MPETRILVTGGLGYIGSHTVVALIEAGYTPIIIDNLSNSSDEVAASISRITNTRVAYKIIDVRDTKKLENVLAQYRPEAVIHFAALKSVSQSIEQPLEYYSNNVEGTLSLLQAMLRQSVSRIIFSSSATVYGETDKPAREDMKIGDTTNPYGNTKVMCERILKDTSVAQPNWRVCSLRYFNPLGAHMSGLIGDNPRGTPNNLMPYITQVATGGIKMLKIYGDDYPTPDGTGIRDYIHVVDLAKGHVAALNHLRKGLSVYNLGTGKGSSVREVIETFEKVSKKSVPYKVVQRRKGDLPIVTADPTKALNELNWRASLTLEDMCRDSWRWQSLNPKSN